MRGKWSQTVDSRQTFPFNHINFAIMIWDFLLHDEACRNKAFLFNLRKLWFRTYPIIHHHCCLFPYFTLIPQPVKVHSVNLSSPLSQWRNDDTYSSWNHIINALNWINLWHFPWLNNSNNIQLVRIHETDRKSGCVTVEAIFNSCRKCFLAQTRLYLAQTHSHTFNRWDEQEPDTFLTVPSWI